MSPEIEIVDEFKSPEGVRGRLARMQSSPGESPYAAALVYLQARGCGAWQGRTACASRAKWVMVGGAGLTFLTYRAVHPEGMPGLAVLCDHHAENLTSNMPAALLRSQEYELRAYLRRVGAGGREAAAREVAVLPLDEHVLGQIERFSGGERKTI